MTKSIKIKLNYLNNDKKHMFLDLLNDIKSITNRYLEIKKNEIENKTIEQNWSNYKDLRKEFKNVNSIILQQVMRSIDGNIKAYQTWCKKCAKRDKNKTKKTEVKFPSIERFFIPLRSDMFHFEWNQNTKCFDAWLRIFRKHFPLKLCDYHKKALENLDKVVGSSIYLDRSGTLCLRLVFKVNKSEVEQTNKVLGVDIGIEKPIVCSDGKMFGNGKLIRHKKLEYSKKRARQQSRKKEIFQHQSRWTADVNHKLSRQLVNYCLSTGVSVLHLEKLSGNHLSNKKGRRYSWAFNDLLCKIRYKAELAGLSVVDVNPAYTSQTCSRCGLKSKDNRVSQSKFICSFCGLKKNADVNASKNIFRFSAINEPSVNLATG